MNITNTGEKILKVKPKTFMTNDKAFPSFNSDFAQNKILKINDVCISLYPNAF